MLLYQTYGENVANSIRSTPPSGGCAFTTGSRRPPVSRGNAALVRKIKYLEERLKSSNANVFSLSQENFDYQVEIDSLRERVVGLEIELSSKQSTYSTPVASSMGDRVALQKMSFKIEDLEDINAQLLQENAQLTESRVKDAKTIQSLFQKIAELKKQVAASGLLVETTTAKLKELLGNSK